MSSVLGAYGSLQSVGGVKYVQKWLILNYRIYKVNHHPNVPLSTDYAVTQTASIGKLAGLRWDEFPLLSRLSIGTWLLGAYSCTQEAAVTGCLAPGAAVCAGTSVRDSALVELSFVLVPFYCCLPPAQVLLEEIRCWTCCFEALMFSGNKRLLAAGSCLTCPASNQGLRHRLHQRWCQRPSLTVQEKIEVETTLFWMLLEGCHLSRWHPQK